MLNVKHFLFNASSSVLLSPILEQAFSNSKAFEESPFCIDQNETSYFEKLTADFQLWQKKRAFSYKCLNNISRYNDSSKIRLLIVL